MPKAKVITMTVKLNSKHTMILVTTVDPIITPEMVFYRYGLTGHIISSKESKVMPLPFALEYSSAERTKLGFTC